MSNINRNNYEAYFLDYHEGILSASEIDLLMLFVEQNEDLQEELFSFESVELVASKEKFSANNNLKNPDGISEKEALIIGNIEGVLTTEEYSVFSKLIAENPNLQIEKNAYKKTLLLKEKIIFDGKKKLKHQLKLAPILLSMTLLLTLSIFLFYPFESKDVKRTYFKTSRNISGNYSFPVVDNLQVTSLKKDVRIPDTTKIKGERQTKAASRTRQKSHLEKINLESLPLNIDLKQKVASPALENKLFIEKSIDPKQSDFLKPKDYLIKSLDKKINGKSSVPISNVSSFLEKTIEKVTKKETKITSSNTKNRKKFSIKIGRFEYSKNKIKR